MMVPMPLATPGATLAAPGETSQAADPARADDLFAAVLRAILGKPEPTTPVAIDPLSHDSSAGPPRFASLDLIEAYLALAVPGQAPPAEMPPAPAHDAATAANRATAPPAVNTTTEYRTGLPTALFEELEAPPGVARARGLATTTGIPGGLPAARGDVVATAADPARLQAAGTPLAASQDAAGPPVPAGFADGGDLPLAGATPLAGTIRLPDHAAGQSHQYPLPPAEALPTEAQQPANPSGLPDQAWQLGRPPSGAAATATSAASAEATAAPVQPDQLGTTLRSLLVRGDRSAVLNLEPAELGRVEINLELSGGKLLVALAADRAEGHEALQAQAPQLRAALELAGLHVERLQLSWSGADQNPAGRQDGDPARGQQARQPASGDSGGGAGEPEEPSAAPSSPHMGTIDYRV